MKKRIFALLLTLCMLLTLLPSTAFAAGDGTAAADSFDALKSALENPDISTIAVTAPIAFTSTLTINRSISFTADEETVFSLADTFTGRHFSVNSNTEPVAVDFGSITLDGGGAGGGLDMSIDKPVSLIGGVIQNCRGSSEGGAIHAVTSSKSKEVRILSLNMNKINQNSASEGGAVYLSSGSPNSINAKLEIQGGEFSGNTASSGGAVYSFFCKEIAVSGGTLDRNEASGKGGAFYLVGGAFRITDGTISGNSCPSRGGALYMAGGNKPASISIEGGEFIQNRVEKAGVVTMGGAICMTNEAMFSMSGGSFSGNSANRGGAICQESGSSASFSISGGEFTDNEATGSSGGGAVYIQSPAADFNGAAFTGNQATHASGAGGAICGAGTKSFTNCIFRNNSAANGGAVSSDAGKDVAIDGCTFEGNSAAQGGAVSMSTSATAKLKLGNNTKFSGNTATKFGGAVCVSSLQFVEADGVSFENNKAPHAYPYLPSGGAIESAHSDHILNTAYTGGLTHAFNNYDIGPKSGTPDAAAMGAKYFRISLEAGEGGSLANPPAEPYFKQEGTELTEAELNETSAAAIAGFAFSGWKLDDGSEPVLPIEITEDIRLTALFVISHTLSFETNGGSAVASISAADGSKIALDQETTKSGYLFTGWYEEAALTQKLTEVTLTADKTVYAGWKKKSSGGGSGGGSGGSSATSYTIAFETNGGSTVKQITQTKGTKIVLDQKTEREGYTFTGWYADKSLGERITSLTLERNITVYAGWQRGLLNKDPKLGYLKGSASGLFLPDSNMTRSEAAAMFYNLLLDQKAESSTVFSDIQGSEWFAASVQVLAGKGILKGSNGYFRPNDSITRAEFAAIIVHLLTDEREGAARKFTDVEAGHWAAKDIDRISALGFITGYPDGTFRPDQCITRAEAVKIVNRLLDRVPDKLAIDALGKEAQDFPDVPDTHWAFYEIHAAINGVRI